MGVAGEVDRPSVLIVDDEERVADTYHLQLRGHYETTVAYSGATALERIDETTDVVLLDRQMPDHSGDEVLEAIRDRGFDVRVVLLTAVDPDFDIVDMACDDYVVKPVGRDELQAVVERALKITTYNERRRELSSTKLKRNVLEVELSPPELAASDTYADLEARIDSLESTVDELEDDLDLEDRSRYL